MAEPTLTDTIGAWCRAATRLVILLSVVATVTRGQEHPTTQPGAVYKISVAAFAVAATADIASSYTVSRGRSDVDEMNPFVFGTQDGRFTGRTVVVQGGVTAGLVVAQYLAARKWPKSRRFFTAFNFGWAGTHAWAAQHNWRLKQ